MARYLAACADEHIILAAEYAVAAREAEIRRPLEYTKAVLIQTWWRFTSLRLLEQRQLAAATCLQRVYRGWLGRKLYRARLLQAEKEMEAARYFQAAQQIQAVWRGYRTRQAGYDFWARKEFLAAVTERNAIARELISLEAGLQQARLHQEKVAAEERRKQLRLSRQHHLLSTKAVPGVFASDKGSQDEPPMDLQLRQTAMGLHLATSLRPLPHSRMSATLPSLSRQRHPSSGVVS